MSAQSVQGSVELGVGGRHPSRGIASRNPGQGWAKQAWPGRQRAAVALVVAHADAAGTVAAGSATSGSTSPRPVQQQTCSPFWTVEHTQIRNKGSAASTSKLESCLCVSLVCDQVSH